MIPFFETETLDKLIFDDALARAQSLAPEAAPFYLAVIEGHCDAVDPRIYFSLVSALGTACTLPADVRALWLRALNLGDPIKALAIGDWLRQTGLPRSAWFAADEALQTVLLIMAATVARRGAGVVTCP